MGHAAKVASPQSADPKPAAARGADKENSPRQSADQLRQLQASYGNRSVNRMLDRTGGSVLSRPVIPPAVQDELKQPGAPLDSSVLEAMERRLEPVVPADPRSPLPALPPRLVIADPQSSLEAQADQAARRPDAPPATSKPKPAGSPLAGLLIHTGEGAARAAEAIEARAFMIGRHIVFNRGEYQPFTSGGQYLLAHELTHALQQATGQAPALLQRAPKTPAKAATGSSFWFSVSVSQELDSEALLLEFIRQYRRLDTLEAAKKQKEIDGWHWSGGQPQVATAADVKKRYVLIHVTDATIAPADAAARKESARQFGALTEGEQAKLNEEADRQFWEKTNYKPDSQLTSSPDDKKMAEYWLVLRNELLRQRTEIESLPPSLKKFLFTEGAPRTLGPRDYGAILRIAEKLKGLTDSELEDYKHKVTGETTDLASFEASIDRYLTERSERIKELKTRETRKTRIYGTEEIFKLYNAYKEAENIASIRPSGSRDPDAYIAYEMNQERAATLKAQLTEALDRRGYKTIGAFEQAIAAYRSSFETETLRVAEDMLRNYENVLYLEEKRYRDPAASAELARSVGGSQAKALYAQAQQTRMSAWMSAPPAGGGAMLPGTLARIEQAAAEEAAASAEVTKAASGHPLVANRDFERKELAHAAPGEVHGIIQDYIDDRREDIQETRANLKDDPDLIYKLDELLAASYEAQNIGAGTIYDLVINDKRDRLRKQGIVKAVVLAVIAVAAGLLSFGTGTVAVVAAGAAFGIGAFHAIEAFHDYAVKHHAYGAKMLSEDPSFAWVIVAVVGAGLDLGVAVSVFAKGTQAAKAIEAFNASGDVAKLKTDLEAVQELTEAMRLNVVRAGEAQKDFRAALKGLFASASSPHMFIGGSEAFIDLVKVVYYGAKRGVIAFDTFVLQLRAEKLLAEGALEPEVVAHLTAAFEEAKVAAETVATHGKSLGLTEAQTDAFINMWAKSKTSKLEDVTAQMTSWAATKQSGVPFGFADLEAFETFRAAAVKGLKKAGYGDSKAILQGSSVSGIKYEGQIATLAPADFDVAIAGRSVFERARKAGFPVESNPMRIGPLSPDQIKDLGLNKLQSTLETAAGGERPVNFMIFSNQEAAMKGIQGTNPPSIILE